MSRNFSVHLFKDLKAREAELPVTDFDNFSVFCKFEENQFGDDVAQEFMRRLNSVKSVSNSFSLDLRDNAFTDAHLRGLAQTIARQKDLKELTLWLPNNYLTDDGVIEIFQALEHLKNLRVLVINLEWNFRISNKSVQALCKYLPAMSQLKTLRVLMSK